MLTTQVMIHPEELAEHNRRIEEDNERRRRARLAESNRAAGKPAPRPGAKLFVSTARGIPRRARAGLVFTYGTRAEVNVIDAPDAEVAEKRKAGAYVANVDGAEEILADEALLVHSTGGADPDAAKLRDANAALTEENERLRAELARARANATDPGDGTPGRLKAQEAARAAAAVKSDKAGGKAGGGDFGDKG